jgi:hypothetical protein
MTKSSLGFGPMEAAKRNKSELSTAAREIKLTAQITKFGEPPRKQRIRDGLMAVFLPGTKLRLSRQVAQKSLDFMGRICNHFHLTPMVWI